VVALMLISHTSMSMTKDANEVVLMVIGLIAQASVSYTRTIMACSM